MNENDKLRSYEAITYGRPYIKASISKNRKIAKNQNVAFIIIILQIMELVPLASTAWTQAILLSSTWSKNSKSSLANRLPVLQDVLLDVGRKPSFKSFTTSELTLKSSLRRRVLNCWKKSPCAFFLPRS
jgi:hypothetical protein